MPTTDRRHTPDELARLGTELFNRVVRPALRPEDDGKYVAIDVVSGDYEINQDDYTAVMRLRARHPDADIWLERAGYPAAYRIASAMRSEASGSVIQPMDKSCHLLAELVARISAENRHSETETGPAVGREVW
jgi:hypothetical protein